MNEKEIEQEIQDKGLNAPRLTPGHIDSVIAKEDYHVFPGTTLTVCCLTLVNGFTVTGESAAASPENFNEEIGRKIAKENARNKIWQLEGYLLREKLHTGKLTKKEATVKDAEFYAGMNYDTMEDELFISLKYSDGTKSRCKILGRLSLETRARVNREYILAYTVGLNKLAATKVLEELGEVTTLDK